MPSLAWGKSSVFKKIRQLPCGSRDFTFFLGNCRIYLEGSGTESATQIRAVFPCPFLRRWPSGQISEGAVSSFWMPPVCPGKLQKGSKLGEI